MNLAQGKTNQKYRFVLKDNQLFLPQELFQYLNKRGIKNTLQYLASLENYPNTFCDLGWSLSNVMDYTSQLRQCLKIYSQFNDLEYSQE